MRGRGGFQVKADKGTEGRFFRRHRTRIFIWRFSAWGFAAVSFHILVGITSERLAFSQVFWLHVHHITMAPHLPKSELDTITKLGVEGKTLTEIHCRIRAQRAKRGVPALVVKVIRRVVAGSTLNHRGVETRGRNRSLSTTNTRR